MLMPGYPAAARRLVAECDLVNVHTPLLETALIGRFARRYGKPLVATHHGDLVLPPGLGNRLIRAALFALYRRMARTTSAFVAHTRDYAESSYYLSPYLDRLEVIPPLVEIPLPDRARAQALRDEWAPEGGPVIGYAGRLVEEKRPDLLVRALETIGRRHPDARIVFAGQHDIAYESFWRRQRPLVERFADRLRFVGVIGDPQGMADFYAACDVLALPSDTECFALVQVEAMLCGTPVVMTDIPGGRVPVRATGMGELVPRGDAAALGEGILRVLADRPGYLRPRAEIERQFSTATAVARYRELFRRLTRGGDSLDTAA
jgi:glycosyltransferase involved in cell wall biosynthesis